jgi:hypothetical protein
MQTRPSIMHSISEEVVVIRDTIVRQLVVDFEVLVDQFRATIASKKLAPNLEIRRRKYDVFGKWCTAPAIGSKRANISPAHLMSKWMSCESNSPNRS